MKHAEDTFKQYAAQFKKMLVCRYNWSVAKAYRFDTGELKTTFERGLTNYEAYWEIFNVEPDDCDCQLL